MAELVPLDRSGDWRRRQRELEEVAVGVRAARPGPNSGPALWAHWRGNRAEPTPKSMSEIDSELILKLERSGRVSLDELLTYHTPNPLLHQGGRIDPANTNITSIVNEMARGRRVLLDLEMKEKSDTAEAKKMSNKVFAEWPADIQMLQGEVTDCKLRHVKPRYVRIPPLLVTKISLLK